MAAKGEVGNVTVSCQVHVIYNQQNFVQFEYFQAKDGWFPLKIFSYFI